jgi:hypothetical protein
VANLPRLKEFAAENNFGLTNPLTHEQVKLLAAHWLPEMRFYEEEKFHPISMDETFTMVDSLFGSLPEPAQAEWLVRKFVRLNDFTGEFETFEPPVVHVPNGFVFQQIGQPATPVPVVRIITEGTSARNGLEDSAVGTDAVITHGANFKNSNQFFGGFITVAGGAEASAGDPFLPRAAGADGRPVITVMASLLNLFELLKYELLVEEDGDNYPPDALRGAFDIAFSLVTPIGSPPAPLTSSQLRKFLLDMIAAQESGGPTPNPPFGWRLNRTAWNAVTRFTFLEYDFFYAFNDFDRYQDALFANHHEGDNEGCCLVFDRTLFNIAPNNSNALLRAIPHSMITAVHEEFQDSDHFKFIDPPLSFPPELQARDVVQFTVYIAAGSHATYLTGGTHDLVDFQDYLAKIEENPIVLLFPGAVIVALIILAIIEHFTDTEDVTSDDGIHSGPDDVVGPIPTAVASQLVVMPMSAENHIYGEGNEDLLRLRTYAGKWGANDSTINHSPEFTPKTGRYFRKLLSKI